ncbi:MAG: helix-turn-helix transcriptional regulator [Caldilineaceae bacterium]
MSSGYFKIMKRFGEKLRLLRQRQGLSQTELGKQLGVQQSYVGKMERGEKLPTAMMLTKIAELFHVSFDQLMDDSIKVN